jgi:hypothetical protein
VGLPRLYVGVPLVHVSSPLALAPARKLAQWAIPRARGGLLILCAHFSHPSSPFLATTDATFLLQLGARDPGGPRLRGLVLAVQARRLKARRRLVLCVFGADRAIKRAPAKSKPLTPLKPSTKQLTPATQTTARCARTATTTKSSRPRTRTATATATRLLATAGRSPVAFTSSTTAARRW